MNITLSNGQTVRGDMVYSITIRSDLVAIPETLTASFKADNDLKAYLSEGETLKAGIDDTEYQIIWVDDNNQSGLTQGERQVGSTTVIAVLKCVYELALMRRSAVIKDSGTIGGVYRSCGATASIKSDLSCDRFACLTGNYATQSIAMILQEESASPVWDGHQLSFIRNKDLMKKSPTKTFDSDTTKVIKSGFTERHEIPMYYSTDGGEGNLQAGDTSKVRGASFIPRRDLRILRNMSKVLVNKRIMESSYSPRTRAGDVFDIAGLSQVVITAVHVTGIHNQYSRFWLGELVS